MSTALGISLAFSYRSGILKLAPPPPRPCQDRRQRIVCVTSVLRAIGDDAVLRLRIALVSWGVPGQIDRTLTSDNRTIRKHNPILSHQYHLRQCSRKKCHCNFRNCSVTNIILAIAVAIGGLFAAEARLAGDQWPRGSLSFVAHSRGCIGGALFHWVSTPLLVFDSVATRSRLSDYRFIIRGL